MVKNMTSDEIENSVKIMSKRSKYILDDPEIIRTIHDQIYPTKKYDEFSKHVNHIVIILSELYSCHKSVYDCLSYSRDRNAYNTDGQYGKSGLSYSITIKVIDELLCLGYIENSNGFNDKSGRNSRTARMRATMKLVVLIQSIITPEEILSPSIQVVQNHVVFKDFSKRIQTYEQNDLTREWQHTLEEYNLLLSKSNITSDIIPKKHMNPDKTTVRRSFSDYSFSLGGRFYGGWWMDCPSKYRPYITINNEKTVEIDYKANHLIIAYSMIGIDYNAEIGDDPYYISTIKDCDKHRKLIKDIILNSLTCKNEASVVQVVNYNINVKRKFKNHPDYTVKELIAPCLEHHYRLSELFYRQIGSLLQYNDSTIANNIIKYFTNKGTPVLSVHDSFICQLQYQDELNEFMIKRFKDVYGVSIITKSTIM